MFYFTRNSDFACNYLFTVIQNLKVCLYVLQAMMKGVPHHLVGEHVWRLGKCVHAPMETLDRVEKPILDRSKNASTIFELFQVLFNKRAVDRIPHLLKYR